MYECQRPTLLEHPNPHISVSVCVSTNMLIHIVSAYLVKNALELLERYYHHVDYQHGDTRALAFRKASCAIKVFPKFVDVSLHEDKIVLLHVIQENISYW